MNTIHRTLAIAAVVLLLGSLVTVYAAQAKTFEGQLMAVDSKAMTITVKGTTGPMTFTYTDRTQITGAGKGAQGLSDTIGTQVRVEYTQTEKTNTASKIEVVKGGE